MPVDGLVAAKVQGVIKALEADAQLCDAIWPLVTMTDKVVELKRKAEEEQHRLRALLDKPQAEAA